ncbi:MAG: hypothetical protein ACK48S_04745 [Planctomycetia bacterium]
MRRARKRRDDRITTFLRRLISPFDFGIKTKGSKPHPVHVNKKDTIRNAFTNKYWKAVKRLHDRDFGSHFMGKDTFYFTGNGRSSDPCTLVMIDIDCHKSGTYEGAVAFVEFLRNNHFPNLYWESSTNGNGIHGYVILQKLGYGDVFVNKMLDRLQMFLRSVLQSNPFDVEGVEIKGHCTEIVWGKRKGEIETVTFGQLGKIPRDAHRFAELKNTTRLTCDQVMRLPVQEQSTNRRGGKRPPASVSGCFVSDDELSKSKTTYLRLAQLLMENHRLPTTNKSVVMAEDISLFIMFLKFFSENMNPDGSLPFARFEKFWNAVFESGDIDRGFQTNRFCVIRNYLSSLGLIEWEDAKYKIGNMCADGKRRGGKAAKWRASLKLLDLIGMVELAEKEGNIPDVSAEAAGANSGSRRERSFAITNITHHIQNLTPTPYSMTIRPVEIHDPPPLMLNPDEIMSHLPQIETMWTVAF